MAIEAGTDPAEAWQLVRRNAKQIKLLCQGMNTTLAAGDSRLEYIFDNVYRPLKNSKAQLDALALTPNLNAYVITVTGNALYNATSEIADATAAMQAAMDWINTNANGLNLTGDTAENYIANGSAVTNRFSAAQTSGLRTLIAAVIASIDD